MRPIMRCFLQCKRSQVALKQPNTGFSKQTSPFLYHVPFRNYIALNAGFQYEEVLSSYYVRFYNKSNGRNQGVLERKGRKVVLSESKFRIRKDVEILQSAIQEKREKLKTTERKIRARGKMIMEDMKETKEKMKEKMEEAIERENIYTIPNLICVTRIVFSPLLGYLIIAQNFEFALVFMTIAGISDWVDGWIARNYKSQSSKIGSFLDPMADKVLIGTLFISLTYVNLIPVALTALILGRDVILVAAGFVIRYRSLPPPRTLSRYFDATHATAQLAPTTISKVNTGVQLLLVASTLAAPVLGYVGHPLLQVLWYITAASTICAAGSYVLSKETYRYLKEQSKPKS